VNLSLVANQAAERGEYDYDAQQQIGKKDGEGDEPQQD
jgi:hypothetical protein